MEDIQSIRESFIHELFTENPYQCFAFSATSNEP